MLGSTAFRAAREYHLSLGRPMAIDMSTKSSATIVTIMLRMPSIHPATELSTMEITGNSP